MAIVIIRVVNNFNHIFGLDKLLAFKNLILKSKMSLFGKFSSRHLYLYNRLSEYLIKIWDLLRFRINIVSSDSKSKSLSTRLLILYLILKWVSIFISLRYFSKYQTMVFKVLIYKRLKLELTSTFSKG